MLAVDLALLAGLAWVDKAKDWGILDFPWWAWLLLGSPALLMMILFLTVPLAELSPGRLRNAGVALLGLLVAADAFGVGSCCSSRLRAATREASSGGAAASPMAAVVWAHQHHRPSGCCSGCSTRADRASAPSADGPTPTSSSRRTALPAAPAGTRG